MGYIEANPDDAECIAYHRQLGQFVPVARDGALLCLVNKRLLDLTPLATPLPVEDYVVGLEMLGFTFALWAPTDGTFQSVLMGEPLEDLPPGWDRQACRIRFAFGFGRGKEVVAFLRERDGEPHTPAPTSSSMPIPPCEEPELGPESMIRRPGR